ncbi:prolyl oligopeptidase family serine peptidase [Fodinibius sp.]|uniref:carboxylesterase family protein n=1 Tax=Fodinibius sp. TaxID=1872440 RepID=UPI002ACEB842|nr:prolyl oligopeptidase family serine peptidase [Fodinibius sp.]MDZ7659155.1 prolyl oligopeptidase family serine peptidase [Fodinibius sp.]
MRKIFVTIGLLFLFFGIAEAQITDFEPKVYTDSDGEELQYRILKPANYDSTKSYPLVLFLHGAGERGNDNYSQLKWGVSHFAEPKFRERYPAFVIAPQMGEGEFWSQLITSRDTTAFTASMGETPTRPMRLTIELLEELQDKYSVDSNRLYVTGISMGGFGTFDLIQRFPNKFAAAVPVCGGGDVTRAFMLTDIPIWAFHGTNDEVVQPEFSRSMIEAIRIAGGSPGYTEYPDEGHIGAWVQAYRNPHLYEWMFSKELSSAN